MKVTVLVGGRFFAFDIARELQRQGRLAAMVTAYARAPREGIRWDRLRWNPLIDAGQRLERRLFKTPEPELDLRVSSRFGRWASRRIPRCDVLQAWTGYALEPMRAAKARGILAVATRASSHISTQARLLEEEYAAFGFPITAVSPRMIDRERREYEEGDFVQVFSTFALNSFLEHGFSRERLLLTPLAVDVGEVEPLGERPIAPDGPLRVLYLGQIGLRKGIHYLMDAARRVGEDAVSVSLVGGLAPEGEVLLKHCGATKAWRGGVPRSELRQTLAEHDVLVLPSIEDGFGAVIVEALAAGLPVIATTNTGGPDVIEDGRTGFVVPARDVEALAGKLALLQEDRERCREMGRAAAEAMRARRTWKKFVDDMVEQYRGALARGGDVTGRGACAS